MTIVVVHETRDEGGRWLWERLDSFTKGSVYFRRRPGQTRQEVTEEEFWAAVMPEVPEPDYSRPEPASVWEQPNFGPRRRL